MIINEFCPQDIKGTIAVWNRVVSDGVAFPQTYELTEDTGLEFFESQSFTGVAHDDAGRVIGLYILHPNNVGRCCHIANASYAVCAQCRGQHIGKALVEHSLRKAKELSFRVMQFNAVVASNEGALHLYRKLGFTPLGAIPGGFRMKNGSFEDIVPHYKEL